MFQFNKLIGLMAENGITQRAAAKKLGISENSFTNKIKCRSNFTSEEIASLCELLYIPSNMIGEYFFTPKV